MGGTYWSSNTYSTVRTATAAKPASAIFTTTAASVATSGMDPHGVKIRECRDSTAHPETTGIGVFLDVTGSMGRIPEDLVKNNLGTLMETLIANNLPDCQVLFGAVGDELYDSRPLQVGQFESGTTELLKWLTSAYIERGGGGNKQESYELAWYFMANHTAMDCVEKRGVKGFIFTIGDEGVNDLNGSKITNIMGLSETVPSMTTKALFDQASRDFHIFHIHVNNASYRNDSQIFNQWRAILGERFLVCEDHNDIAALIASTVAVVHGLDMASVLSTLPKNTVAGVSTALAPFVRQLPSVSSGMLTL